MYKRAVHRGAFYYPCYIAWLQMNSYGELMGITVIYWGYGLSAIPTYCLRVSSGSVYGTTEVSQKSVTNPSTKVSAPVSTFYKTRSLR